MLSLYRRLLRRSRKLEPDHAIRHELQYHINEAFRSKYPTNERLLQALVKGHELAQLLESGHDILPYIQKHRNEQFIKQKQRANYLRNKTKVEREMDKQMSGKDIKRKLAKITPPRPRKDIFAKLSPSEQFDVIKDELAASRHWSQQLFNQWVREKQRRNEVPVPQTLLGLDAGRYPKRYTVAKSARRKYMEQAYDMDYVEAIVKPGIAYDINMAKIKTMERYLHSGPYLVKVAQNTSGPFPAAYTKLPYNRPRKMQELALLIKKSTRLVRVANVWNGQVGGEENRNPDGSVTIPKCGDILPRHHYESLTRSEALWEHLRTGKPLQKCNSEWTWFLDVSSESVRNDVLQVQRELKQRRDDCLEEQPRLQKKMDAWYDRSVRSYANLMEALKRDGVFKHSEIVNGSVNTVSYMDRLGGGKSIPELERLGMGKELGDYMGGFFWGRRQPMSSERSESRKP